jgi:hypothetical protein
MSVVVTNNAWGTLSVAINESATTLVLSTAQGDRFPGITESSRDVFYVTLIDSSNNIEIVKCTSRMADALEVVRSQDGTTARSFPAGSRVELRPTAALFADKVAQDVFADYQANVTEQFSQVDSHASQLSGDVLHKTGGVMTGSIQYNPDGFAGYFGGAVDAGKVMRFGWNFKDASPWQGGGVNFNRADRSSDPGAFSVYAQNASGRYSLDGTGTGDLTWGEYNVVTDRGGFTFRSGVNFGEAGDSVKGFWNAVGDDSAFGDGDVGGHFCVKGLNGNPGIAFFSSSEVAYGQITGYSNYVQCNKLFKAANFQNTSDIRHKKNVVKVSYDLSTISPYHYTLIDDGMEHVGLIAQEVEKIIPDAVSESEDGTKTLDYNAVVAALVGEINELKKRVQSLEQERML